MISKLLTIKMPFSQTEGNCCNITPPTGSCPEVEPPKCRDTAATDLKVKSSTGDFKQEVIDETCLKKDFHSCQKCCDFHFKYA